MYFVLTQEELDEHFEKGYRKGRDEGYKNGTDATESELARERAEIATVLYMLARGDVTPRLRDLSSTSRAATTSISVPSPMVGSRRLKRKYHKETDTIELWAE